MTDLLADHPWYWGRTILAFPRARPGAAVEVDILSISQRCPAYTAIFGIGHDPTDRCVEVVDDKKAVWTTGDGR